MHPGTIFPGDVAYVRCESRRSRQAACFALVRCTFDPSSGQQRYEIAGGGGQ